MLQIQLPAASAATADGTWSPGSRPQPSGQHPGSFAAANSSSPLLRDPASLPLAVSSGLPAISSPAGVYGALAAGSPSVRPAAPASKPLPDVVFSLPPGFGDESESLPGSPAAAAGAAAATSPAAAPAAVPVPVSPAEVPSLAAASGDGSGGNGAVLGTPPPPPPGSPLVEELIPPPPPPSPVLLGAAPASAGAVPPLAPASAGQVLGALEGGAAPAQATADPSISPRMEKVFGVWVEMPPGGAGDSLPAQQSQPSEASRSAPAPVSVQRASNPPAGASGRQSESSAHRESPRDGSHSARSSGRQSRFGPPVHAQPQPSSVVSLIGG